LNHGAGAAEHVFFVIVDGAGGDIPDSDASAAEENVLVGEVAAPVGFIEDFGSRAVPVEFAIRFLEAVGGWRTLSPL
jgi:hypothetical protein